MEIREITDKNIWEDFLTKQKDKTFLQSWNWGEFNILMGRKIWRIGVFNNNELAATALIVKTKARRGTYLLIPHGPVVHSLNEDVYNEILKTLSEYIKPLARLQGAAFIRVSPFWKRTEASDNLFAQAGFRKAPIYAELESSWKLDISLPEDDLLKNMRKTTRYLIRQAAKNEDITVQQSSQSVDVEIFDSLSHAVGKRQGFVPFSKEHIEREVAAFKEDGAISMFFGSYKGEVVAAALIIFWSQIGFYHQAASLEKYAKLSIPYLIQWEAIREAKKRGCMVYDFWGYVDPKKYPKHPWAGPTLFKMGFGGEPRVYAQTRDLPLSWKYWPTAAFETFRRIRRHL